MYLFIFGCDGFVTMRAFLQLPQSGTTLVAMGGLLIAVASLVAERGCWGLWASLVEACRLSS